MLSSISLIASLALTADLPNVDKQRIALHLDQETGLDQMARFLAKNRVVQLGELTHGDGTSFSIKAKLVKRLHQKFGFEVVIFESGLIGAEAMNDAWKTRTALEVPMLGIFSHWSESAEISELWEYMKLVSQTKRPLRISGSDIQFSAAIGETWLTETAQKYKISGKETHPYDWAVRFAEQTDWFSFVPDSRERGLIRQGAKAYLAFGKMVDGHVKFTKSQSGADFAASYNLREDENYKLLKWLCTDRYKGKKIVVWAHNAHVCNSGGDGFYDPSAPKESAILDSTGRQLKQLLGKDLYTVGFVAQRGGWSWLGNPVIPLPDAQPDGIEAVLGRNGPDHSFLDLRQYINHPWFKAEQPGRMNAQNGRGNPVIWPKAFDGLIYIREMKPRVQIKQNEKG